MFYKSTALYIECTGFDAPAIRFFEKSCLNEFWLQQILFHVKTFFRSYFLSIFVFGKRLLI